MAKGPQTVGIFRKSANARVCRELKTQLEQFPDKNLNEFPIPVIASVLKVRHGKSIITLNFSFIIIEFIIFYVKRNFCAICRTVFFSLNFTCDGWTQSMTNTLPLNV